MVRPPERKDLTRRQPRHEAAQARAHCLSRLLRPPPSRHHGLHPPTGTKFTREEMAGDDKVAEMWKSIKPDELAYCKSEALKMKMEYDAAKAACPLGLKKAKGRKKNAADLDSGPGRSPSARAPPTSSSAIGTGPRSRRRHPGPFHEVHARGDADGDHCLAVMWKMVSQRTGPVPHGSRAVQGRLQEARRRPPCTPTPARERRSRRSSTAVPKRPRTATCSSRRTAA